MGVSVRFPHGFPHSTSGSLGVSGGERGYRHYRGLVTVQGLLPATRDRLIDLAVAQFGVLSTAQIEGFGYSPRRRRTLAARGILRRHLGCWVVSSIETQAGGRDAHALRLSLPEGTIVTGAAAAALLGAGGEWPYEHGVAVPMAYASPGSNPARAGVQLIRRAFDGRCARRGPLRLADRVTALLDCVEAARPSSRTGLVDYLLQRRWITPRDIDTRWAARHGSRVGRRATAALREAVAQSRSGTQSAAERLLARALRAGGLGRGGSSGWSGNHLVRVADATKGGRELRPYRIDFAWPDCRLAVEVDGRSYHSSDGAFEGDRERRVNMQTAGWTVMEFTWRYLAVDPGAAAAVAVIRSMLVQLRARQLC